jgi:hypothetical protein
MGLRGRHDDLMTTRTREGETVNQPSMEPTSFAGRRAAANSLGNFSLPAPDIPSTRYPNHNHSHSITITPRSGSSGGPRVPSLSTMTRSPPPYSPLPPSPPLTRTNSSSNAAAGTGFLTPSSGVASDGLSPASGGVNTGSSGASQPGSNHALYYPGSWPTPGGLNSAYTYNSTSSAPASASLAQPHQYQRSSVYGQVSPSLPQGGMVMVITHSSNSNSSHSNSSRSSTSNNTITSSRTSSTSNNNNRYSKAKSSRHSRYMLTRERCRNLQVNSRTRLGGHRLAPQRETTTDSHKRQPMLTRPLARPSKLRTRPSRRRHPSHRQQGRPRQQQQGVSPTAC